MTAVAVLGDVHGDLGRLRAMFDALDKDDDRVLILLGDYVDHGPNPAGVLDFLVTQRKRRGERLVLLKGNHDSAFLEFLRGGRLAPVLANGGATTVRSYLGNPVGEVARRLRAAVPQSHVDLLASLQDAWSDEAVLALHKWPVDRVEVGDRFVVLGHYRQDHGRPFVGTHEAYIDTGCGAVDGHPLTCLLLPERTWTSI